MKKLIALLLALSICVMCAACGGEKAPETTESPAETTAPVTEATAPATTEAEEAEPVVEVYTNPLTGEVLDAPYSTRPVVVSISNIPEALPHRGVNDADIIIESLVNGSIVRCLAIYSDISEVESVGSVRSARPILIDIAAHFRAFYAHAGGSRFTNKKLASYGIDNMNVDTQDDRGYAFRDKERSKTTDWEHCLFIRGSELMDHIVNKLNVDMSPLEDTYKMQFVEDGTPADGETANTVSISLKYEGTSKETVMVYNADTGLYEFNQYGKTMIDEADGQPEAFTNVIVMYTKMSMHDGYHLADFVAGGTGYYACGGKIIPITWDCEKETRPFNFYTLDGEVLNLGVGSTYIALTTDGAPVSCG